MIDEMWIEGMWIRGMKTCGLLLDNDVECV